MRNRIPRILAAATLPVLLAVPAFASSHREAPAISQDPTADNTDVYAWVEGQGTAGAKLIVIANYIPLEEPAGGPNFSAFSDDVRYEIHITKGTSLNDFLTYEIQFDSSEFARTDPADLNAGLINGKEFFSQLSGKTQQYKVVKVAANGNRTRIGNQLPVALNNIGPRTDAVAYGITPAGRRYDDAFAATFIRTLNDGTRAFAGPRDDGFYVDLGGVFDLAALRGKGVAQDGVSGFNTHSIALEIPIAVLGIAGTTPSNDSTLGVWASASRRKVSILKNNGERETSGPFVQVSRLGLPLVNEALIGLQDKDRWNASKPKDDVALYGAYFLNPVVVRDAEAVGIYTALNVDPNALGLKSNRTDILDVISLKDANHNLAVGDVLRVDVNQAQGFPNGRRITGAAAANQEQADVTDVLLTVILATAGNLGNNGVDPARPPFVRDGVDNNDKDFLSVFPYLPLPWSGFDEGHGQPTP